MSNKHVFRLMPVTMIAALVLISCGSDDSSCDAPITITPGTWCITLQSTQNTCSEPLDPTPYTAAFTQNENSLTAISQFGHTYTGTICGSNAIMTGNNYGITTRMEMVFPDVSSASGSVDWTTPGCSGTDTYIAVAGNCL